MAKGSQLAQLKAALSQAGVTGKPSTSKKRKRQSAPLEKEKEKRAARLEEIHRRLNPFDVKVTKVKHDVGGRKLKGVSGKPSQSKQAGIEQRKKTLLKEWEDRNRAGGIVDRRFGENDPSMSIEERMLERFTRERQRASKGVAFNLEDEDELTHYGQSLSKLDDFDNVGLGFDNEDDEETGQLDNEVVSKTHFGGFDEDGDNNEDDEDEGPARKKSKAEVMAEVIAKSKEHKILRQMEKEQEENLRHQLDNDFSAVLSLMHEPDSSGAGSNVPEGSQKLAGVDVMMSSLAPEVQDTDYDQRVRELAFDKRSKPKDRTKTEEELALEQKESLEKAERQRRKRMLGLEDSESEDEGKPGKRKRGGDDLEDDFLEEENDTDWAGLGTGLDVKPRESESEGEEGDDESDEGSEEDEAEGGERYTSSEEGEVEEGEQELLTTGIPRGMKRVSSVAKELPYTFSAPASHEEFLEIIQDVEDKDIPVVIQRIRTLYHTSLAPDNKLKLQMLAGVLIDHIVYVAALSPPHFALISSLIPHLTALLRAYPISGAQYFNEKLTLMNKNFKRGLSKGTTHPEAKTWPGPSELTLLRVIGLMWSTSDLNHAVVSPARVLMGAYLGLGRIRSLTDIASGLFLCTLFAQYESLSKRLVPEAINFLVNAFLHIAPTKYKDAKSLPGSFPAPDFRSEPCRTLAVKINKAMPEPTKPDFADLLRVEEPNELAKVNLLSLTLDLLGMFGDMYKGLDGFVELYEPILKILQHGEAKALNEDLKSKLSKVIEMLTRLLKFAKQSHRPLALQAHKPIPIPSYIPKFEATTSNYLRKRDPDYEKNEVAKLRYQLKQEKKGAIRELRKDAKFLAAAQQKQQLEKDREYNQRLKKAYSSIESERAEQKATEREKSREKRRAGRK